MPGDPLFLREESLRRDIVLLLSLCRSVSVDISAGASQAGLSRLEAQILQLIGEHRHISPSELAEALNVTRQTLSRSLSGLLVAGHIEYRRAETQDKRTRSVQLTERGVELEKSLYEKQCERLSFALRCAGLEAVEGFRRVAYYIAQYTEQKDQK